MEAKQTPLIDLLERVPLDAVLVVEHDRFDSSSHPIGRLCHESAAALRARASTHAAGCLGWGHRHYECAVRQIERDEALLRQALEALEVSTRFVYADMRPQCEDAIAAQQQDKLDAERWRYIRRKLCLTGNGNGTCAMQAINLPAAIHGWPEPGQIAEFCDAAIDAAMRKENNND